MDGNPTSRALRTLELIQANPGISAVALGERLDVSERAARRYVATLREAGIAVEAARGPYGGFRIRLGSRTAPLRFDAQEALSLVMAVLDGHHDVADPTGEDPVASALTKLLGALSEPVARQADVVRRTATPAPDTAAARPDPKTAARLVQACAEHRVVQMGYRSDRTEAIGSERELIVHPWAVVIRHGRWYLLGHSRFARATRTYRIDRVHELCVLDETFTPPPDVNPVADLETHMALGWEYLTEVIINAPVEEISARTLGRLEPIDETTTRLTGSTSNPWWYAEQLVGLHAPYRIIGGSELCATTRATAQRMLDAVAPPGPLA